MMQLEFNWRDEDGLLRELQERSGMALQVTVTDNTSSILTVKRERGGQRARLRLHRMFLSASPRVLGALSEWICKPRCRQSGRVLDEFINNNLHLIRRRQRDQERLRTAGRHFDLAALASHINDTYFGGSVSATITWGRMPARGRRKSIRFGSYSTEENMVRIHPLLDQDFVPEYFVRYIVFHELLHAHLGVAGAAQGRRSIHGAAFKAHERTYPEYARAVAWQEDPANLRRLLRTKDTP